MDFSKALVFSFGPPSDNLKYSRRAHQTSRTPSFSCKFGGECKISVKNRRRCQSCRYDRCLSAGMSPEMVLTSEQKTVRFRKILLKKQTQKNPTKRSKSEAEDENDSENQNFLSDQDFDDFLDDENLDEVFSNPGVSDDFDIFSFDEPDPVDRVNLLEALDADYNSAFQNNFGKDSNQVIFSLVYLSVV